MQKDFDLKKVKLSADGKVEVTYSIPDLKASHAVSDEFVMVSNRCPHPDLKNAVGKLTNYLADANGLRVHRNLPHIDPKKMEKWEAKEVQSILSVLDAQVYASVIPTGISLYGNDETLQVKITGKHDTGKATVAMNSPKISVNGDTFKFEAELFDVVYEIIDEVRKYILERKSAQLEMDFPEVGTEKKKKEKVLAD